MFLVSEGGREEMPKILGDLASMGSLEIQAEETPRDAMAD